MDGWRERWVEETGKNVSGWKYKNFSVGRPPHALVLSGGGRVLLVVSVSVNHGL